jgi:hypothetical protein
MFLNHQIAPLHLEPNKLHLKRNRDRQLPQDFFEIHTGQGRDAGGYF